MPSLSDSLSALSDYTQQILLLSSSNLQPSGPYTTAYLDSLHLNPASSSSSSAPSKRETRSTGGVLSLIRDAQDSETRLFRFIGEAEVAGVGRVKKVEKRDNIGGKSDIGGEGQGLDVGKGRDEVEVMLRTALRLVDDYRPMPRARATITSLLETHHTQLERVAELELQIEEASNPATTSAPAPFESASHAKQIKGTKEGKPKLSFEEAVEAEEAVLRGMEKELGPLRLAREAASAFTSTSTTSSPSINSIQGFSASSTLPSSPLNPVSVSLASRTPAKTPLSQPKITNSLVNGTTPRRARATPGQSEALTEGFGFEFDRFSPLKFLGTPRARARVSARSNLGGMGAVGMESPIGKGIFGKRSMAETPSKGGDYVEGVEMDEEDQTIRIGLATDIPQQEEERGTGPAQEQQEVFTIEEEQPVIQERPETPKPVKKEKEGYLEGVQVKLPIVAQAITKLQEGLPEMMRQGLAEGQEPPSSVESTITHLVRLSRSDPDPPPSPSSHSTSTLSSAPSAPSAPKPPPITPTTILVAHILLAMLWGEGVSTSMPDLKEDLGAIARARGWEGDGLTGGGGGGGGLATKCIYHVVAKRVARIDRKGRGSVLFAI